MHWRSMLPGPVTERNRLTNAQRWAYLSGALQWYGDLIALIFYFFLLAWLTQQPLRQRWAWGLAAGLGWLCVGLVVGLTPVSTPALRCTPGPLSSRCTAGTSARLRE